MSHIRTLLAGLVTALITQHSPANAAVYATARLSNLTLTAEAIDPSGPSPSFQLYSDPADAANFGGDGYYLSAISRLGIDRTDPSIPENVDTTRPGLDTPGDVALALSTWSASASITADGEYLAEARLTAPLTADVPESRLASFAQAASTYLKVGVNTRVVISGQVDLAAEFPIDTPCVDCRPTTIDALARGFVYWFGYDSPEDFQGLDNPASAENATSGEFMEEQAQAYVFWPPEPNGGGPVDPYVNSEPALSGAQISTSLANEGSSDQRFVVNWGAVAKIDYKVQPVPEPSSIALVGLGLAGAAWVGRRRLHKA